MTNFKDFLSENIEPEKLIVSMNTSEIKLVQDLKKAKSKLLSKDFLIMNDNGIFSGYNIKEFNTSKIDSLKKELLKIAPGAKFKIIKL